VEHGGVIDRDGDEREDARPAPPLLLSIIGTKKKY